MALVPVWGKVTLFGTHFSSTFSAGCLTVVSSQRLMWPIWTKVYRQHYKRADLFFSVGARKHASEGSTLTLKPRPDITISPNRVISGPKKTRIYVLQNFLIIFVR